MVNVSNAKQVINIFVHNPAQRLIQKPKVVQMAVEDLSKLKYAPACDTFVSTTPKLTSKVAPLKKNRYGGGGLARLENGEPIGEFKYDFSYPDRKILNNEYPLSWVDSETGIAKGSLHICYFDTRFAEHQGYGREMMKRFYLESVEAGCEGRICFEPAWESGGFYRALDCFEMGSGKVAEIKEELEYLVKEYQNLIKMKNGGKIISGVELAFIKKQIERCELKLKDPIEHIGVNSIGKLCFTPTPENVSKLFSK